MAQRVLGGAGREGRLREPPRLAGSPVAQGRGDDTRVDGQCHRGEIAYEAEVEIEDIAICHCLDRQRLGGSAFRADVLARADAFRVRTGSLRRYVKTGDSGAKRLHAFCGTCGSPVCSCAVENPPTCTLRVGASNQRQELGRPKRQIRTRRRLPWVSAPGGVPEVGGQP